MNMQNFEPVYAALTSLLLNAGQQAFTANGANGSAVLTGIGSTAQLTPGLAVIGASCPEGNQILSVDSSSQITLIAPMTGPGPYNLTAGFASADPVQARILRHWTDVPTSSLPALFLAPLGEKPSKRPGQIYKWELSAEVWVYVNAPNDQTPPTPALNALLGAIRGALVRDASGPGFAQFRVTLGGLVFDTYFDGKIETDAGYLGSKAVAKVPITMILPGP